MSPTESDNRRQPREGERKKAREDKRVTKKEKEKGATGQKPVTTAGRCSHPPEGPNGSAVSLSKQLVFHSESPSVETNPEDGVAWGKTEEVSRQWTLEGE